MNRQPLRVGDGDVDEAGDVDVEDRALVLGRQRADHAERGEVDALELEAGALEGGGGALDHLAADGDDDDARAQAERRVDDAERLEVQDGLVHRHRDVIRGGGLDGGGERLRVVERRRRGRACARRCAGGRCRGARVLGSSCSAKSALTASASAIGSATSPSRMMPGRSSATAPRVRVREPSTETSAAATWPASSSRPTTLVWWERFFLRSTSAVSAEARGLRALNARSGPEGPLRGGSVRAAGDYQLPPAGQPPLPTGGAGAGDVAARCRAIV